MLPIINGKPLINCTEQDLNDLIGNPDYRENEYLDYKSMFAVDQYEKGDPTQFDKISELRDDVCAFANANSGYLIFGVKEKKGVPTELCGIEIKDNNPDRFEMRLKNYLQTIQPKMPQCSFRFIPQESGRYIVIILVLHDAFAPYFHVKNEKDYHFYKRVGNDKRPIAFTELRNMFIQSTALEKEIERFRRERIEFFRNRGQKRFMLIHVIPDTFTDSSFNKLVFILNRQTNNSLSSMFQSIGFLENPVPMVDGLLRRAEGQKFHRECRLFNNFVAEVYDSLQDVVVRIQQSSDDERLEWNYVHDEIISFTNNAIPELIKHIATKRVFVCISIVGFLGVSTQMGPHNATVSAIDRTDLLISPCVFLDAADSDEFEEAMKRLELEYYLSLGITSNSKISPLINEYEQ